MADADMLKAQQPLPQELLLRMNAYWRAANYLSVGQIYLFDNPLLREPVKLAHGKRPVARQSHAPGAIEAGACQTAGGRTLGYHAGPELHLSALEPGHQQQRSQHDLHRLSRSRRS